MNLPMAPAALTAPAPADLTHNRRAGDALARWVCFELAGQLYGLEILKVQEVLADAEVESVPGAPHTVLGISNLRGCIVTVMDLRRRLSLPPRGEPGPTCVIVVDGAGEAVGLRVDRVVDVRSIRVGAVKPAPETGPRASAVLGVVTRSGEVLTLLDAAALIAPLAESAERLAA
jgi:purine-binding chemotaxis protein CheW